MIDVQKKKRKKMLLFAIHVKLVQGLENREKAMWEAHTMTVPKKTMKYEKLVQVLLLGNLY